MIERRMPGMIAAIETRIEVHLSVWDRLRILLGAPMVVFFRAETDKDPGQVVKEESSVLVGRSTGPVGAVVATSPTASD
jgi:hypothetical protein